MKYALNNFFKFFCAFFCRFIYKILFTVFTKINCIQCSLRISMYKKLFTKSNLHVVYV